MDWNKEEAIRAKGIAESKMGSKDFAAARRFALKAQQLCADLENISQMLMVCEVHCAADKKLFGNEMDWYAILQVDQTADEGTIKKQYRKFALQLHPDKNKFPGAEAAFKLIGEAQTLLLDKGKRSLHDVKRKGSTHHPMPTYRNQQKATHSTSSGFQNNVRCSFTSVNLQEQRSRQPATGQGIPGDRPTFWTTCPFCNMKYQYYIEFINTSIICNTCSKPFFACQSMQGAPAATNLNQTTCPQRNDFSNKGDCKVEKGRHGNSYVGTSEKESTHKKGRKADKVAGKVNGKRRKQEEESSDSFDDGSSSDSDEEMSIDEDGDFKVQVNLENCERPRRSTRNKPQVSYKENLSDEDDDDHNLVNHSKGAKRSASSHSHQDRTKNGLEEIPLDMKEPTDEADYLNDQKSVEQKVRNGCQQKTFMANINSSSSNKFTSDTVRYACPDPEFNDFDSMRNGGNFSTKQIWALYDNLDAMPRYYARIVKVLSPGFKLQITWLESDPDDKDGSEWANADLPAACGNFKHGSSELTEDRQMFSHLVRWEKGNRRYTYNIFPRKGEVWAIFKEWDIILKSDADACKKYEYEFVEVLADYTKDGGASVAFLVKVKGFVSLFCQTSNAGKNRVQIPSNELSRFSHMVPSFRMTGEEKEGVPKGCFELDPAALPVN